MTQSKKWPWLILLVFSGLLIYLLSPILSPFLLAALLAYMGGPLVVHLQTWRIPRTLGTVLVLLFFALLLVLFVLLLIPLLVHQIQVFLSYVPAMMEWAQSHVMPMINKYVDTNFTLDLASIKGAAGQHLDQTGTVLTTVWKTISHSSMIVVQFIIDLVLVPVVTFYLLRDWPKVVGGCRSLLPRRIEPTVAQLTRDCNEVLGAFLRGQLLVMLALGVIYSVGLSIIGLDMAFLIGMMAGLASIVPYLGFIVGIAIAIIASLVQFHDGLNLIYVLIVFACGQTLESMVLTPWLVGDRIGLHPVAVIFAIMAGGVLFGFIGILLALPLAAVIMVLLRYARKRYIKSGLYVE